MKSEWKKSCIDEACILVTDGSHSSPKSANAGKYMVSVKDFTPYGFDFKNCKLISEEDYDVLEKSGCVPEIDDILIGKDGARYFEDIIIYRQPERPALLSSIAILRCNKKEIFPNFLYYLLKTPSFKQNVRDNYGSGSAIPRIILKDFKRMPISYPEIETQEKIVSVLVALDNKIELNQKINDNLERQAQAIYTDMFVVNADPAWTQGYLSDLVTIKYGKDHKKLADGSYPVYGSGGIMRYVELEEKVYEYARKIENSDAVQAMQELKDKLRDYYPDYNSFEAHFLLMGWSHKVKRYKTPSKKKEVQYILRGIEDFYLSHTAELSIREFTIEHIANDDGTESHCTIGNLLMLAEPINWNASNKYFMGKIPYYAQSQFISTKKYVERYGHLSNWTVNDIQNRRRFMAKLAYETIWKFE